MAVILMDDFGNQHFVQFQAFYLMTRPKACCFFFPLKPPSRIVFEDPASRGLGVIERNQQMHQKLGGLSDDYFPEAKEHFQIYV